MGSRSGACIVSLCVCREIYFSLCTQLLHLLHKEYVRRRLLISKALSSLFFTHTCSTSCKEVYLHINYIIASTLYRWQRLESGHYKNQRVCIYVRNTILWYYQEYNIHTAETSIKRHSEDNITSASLSLVERSVIFFVELVNDHREGNVSGPEAVSLAELEVTFTILEGLLIEGRSWQIMLARVWVK